MAARSRSPKKKHARPERRPESKPKKSASKAAITRARRRLEELSFPKTGAQQKTEEVYRSQLARTLKRAGFSEASIRSQLGWITRRRAAREEEAKRKRDRRRRRERERRREKEKKKPARTPAQVAAVSRAERRLEELPIKPKTIAHKQFEDNRRQQLIDTMRRAGYTDAEIRARLAQIARRRLAREQTLAAVQAEVLGLPEPIQGAVRENWYVLRNHITNDTPEFRHYIDRAADFDVSYEEAVDRWFSPNAE